MDYLIAQNSNINSNELHFSKDYKIEWKLSIKASKNSVSYELKVIN